jgi:hypothetical protein
MIGLGFAAGFRGFWLGWLYQPPPIAMWAVVVKNQAAIRRAAIIMKRISRFTTFISATSFLSQLHLHPTLHTYPGRHAKEDSYNWSTVKRANPFLGSNGLSTWALEVYSVVALTGKCLPSNNPGLQLLENEDLDCCLARQSSMIDKPNRPCRAPPRFFQTSLFTPNPELLTWLEKKTSISPTIPYLISQSFCTRENRSNRVKRSTHVFNRLIWRWKDIWKNKEKGRVSNTNIQERVWKWLR